MHVVIINGSPRIKNLSNTDKIIQSLVKGMQAESTDLTYELYSVSDRKEWEPARKAFLKNDNILMALPLYFESVPGLFLEFLATLDEEIKGAEKDKERSESNTDTNKRSIAQEGNSTKSGNNTEEHYDSDRSTYAPIKKITYVLQSGFAEASQLRCGERYLEKLTARLGCDYGGTLVKGDNFSIRFLAPKMSEAKLAEYESMGRVFARDQNFLSSEAKAFAGPEYFGLGTRIMVGTMFKVMGPMMFGRMAKSLGCTKSLKYRPYA